MPNRLKLLLTLCLCITATKALKKLKTEVQLERFEQLQGFHLANATGIRVKKFNRSTSVLDGDGETFQDFGNEYKFTLTAAHSRIGNNQFNEYPLKISRQAACDILNGPYKDYQHLIKDSSNMPQVGEERYCPFQKKRYWVRNWAPDSDWVLPVVPTGYWRFTADVFGPEDDVVIRFLMFMRVKRDLE